MIEVKSTIEAECSFIAERLPVQEGAIDFFSDYFVSKGLCKKRVDLFFKEYTSLPLYQLNTLRTDVRYTQERLPVYETSEQATKRVEIALSVVPRPYNVRALAEMVVSKERYIADLGLPASGRILASQVEHVSEYRLAAILRGECAEVILNSGLDRFCGRAVPSHVVDDGTSGHCDNLAWAALYGRPLTVGDSVTVAKGCRDWEDFKGDVFQVTSLRVVDDMLCIGLNDGNHDDWSVSYDNFNVFELVASAN
ncbi:hypothetical protein AB4254_08300 [Vibrio breoganii]